MVDAAFDMPRHRNQTPFRIHHLQQRDGLRLSCAAPETVGLRQLKTVPVTHAFLLSPADHQFRTIRQKFLKRHQTTCGGSLAGRLLKPLQRNRAVQLEFRHGGAPQSFQVRPAPEFPADIVSERADVSSTGTLRRKTRPIALERHLFWRAS